MAYRTFKGRPGPFAAYAVDRDARTCRDELAQRTISTGLVVPAWVRKDNKLYEQVRRMKFTDQTALDEYLAMEAVSRHRTPTRYAARDRNRDYFVSTTNEDVRLRSTARNKNSRNRIAA